MTAVYDTPDDALIFDKNTKTVPLCLSVLEPRNSVQMRVAHLFDGSVQSSSKQRLLLATSTTHDNQHRPPSVDFRDGLEVLSEDRKAVAANGFYGLSGSSSHCEFSNLVAAQACPWTGPQFCILSMS